MAPRNQWLQNLHEMWYNEYLLDFRESSPGRSRLPFQNSFQRDDVVLIKNPLKPRLSWTLGTILDIILGDDGVMKSARVR